MTKAGDGMGPERILVLAPIGRDAPLLCQVLDKAGFSSATCSDMRELAYGIEQGAGAALMTDEVLDAKSMANLLEVLAAQPAWADMPIVLLLSGYRTMRQAQVIDALRSAGSLTVLARPVRGVSLITTVQTVLRARRRQYEIRDLIMREQAARQEADAASQLKDLFLATISHELRTPLTAVLLRTRLLLRHQVHDAQVRHSIEVIERNAETQSRLVEDLLDVSRMVSGNFPLEMQDVELGPIIAAAMDVVRPSAETKGIQLESVVSPGTVFLRADPHRLQQVVWNLLSNSVKFTPHGGSVWIRSWQAGGKVFISVADTGKGIEPSFLPYVFDHFRQADPSEALRQRGLGLGLGISRHIVEAHGGTIRAESEGPGKGAVFAVTLPSRRSDSGPTAPA